MSDTPETDDMLRWVNRMDEDDMDMRTMVPADFVRSLERRLRQCDIERAKWKAWTEAALREVEEIKERFAHWPYLAEKGKP